MLNLQHTNLKGILSQLPSYGVILNVASFTSSFAAGFQESAGYQNTALYALPALTILVNGVIVANKQEGEEINLDDQLEQTLPQLFPLPHEYNRDNTNRQIVRFIKKNLELSRHEKTSDYSSSCRSSSRHCLC